MERFDFTLGRLRKPAFDEVPDSSRRRLFGVDYVHLKGRQQGDLFVTGPGWEVIESLLPEHWFVGRKFSKVGRALAGATGAVFRVPVPHRARPDFAIVVKFSRFCQGTGEVTIEPALNFSQDKIDRIMAGHFLAPFEEFGNVLALQRSAGWEIPLKTPLAIYCPPARYLHWQLGRQPHLQSMHSQNLLEDQAHLPEAGRLDYDWERQYILLYRWLNGFDAEQACDSELIRPAEMVELGHTARLALERHGWEVLDHKPRHVILRRGRGGGLARRRRGELLWGLVDYELLYPCRR